MFSPTFYRWRFVHVFGSDVLVSASTQSVMFAFGWRVSSLCKDKKKLYNVRMFLINFHGN